MIENEKELIFCKCQNVQYMANSCGGKINMI